MNIQKHPHFIRHWKKMFFLAIAIFLTGLLTIILMGKSGGELERIAQTAFLPFFGFAVIMVVTLAALPYRVTCARCQGRTKTRARRPELSDRWSALCERCGILWDLELGNDRT